MGASTNDSIITLNFYLRNLLSPKKNNPMQQGLKTLEDRAISKQFFATKAKKQHYYSSIHRGDMSVYCFYWTYDLNSQRPVPISQLCPP